jgi:hypothetical protein
MEQLLRNWCAAWCAAWCQARGRGSQTCRSDNCHWRPVAPCTALHCTALHCTALLCRNQFPCRPTAVHDPINLNRKSNLKLLIERKFSNLVVQFVKVLSVGRLWLRIQCRLQTDKALRKLLYRQHWAAIISNMFDIKWKYHQIFSGLKKRC